MGLNETKRLLRASGIVPNRLLSQNFMIEPALYVRLVDYACLNREDVVLDAGAGFGFLTRYLAGRCKRVIAVERDPRVASVLRDQVKDCGNVQVVEGDVLKVKLPSFCKVVAIPPYSLSSKLVTWLIGREPRCVVLILQREFAEKLAARVGSDAYGWLTVLASYDVETALLDDVPRTLFYPVPEVDSVIVRMSRRGAVPFRVRDGVFFKRLVRGLFTQRNRRLSNALVPLLTNVRQLSKKDAERIASSVPFAARRVRELAPSEFGELADVLSS
jgi:16S rRNA (adenine1518-N6/adenine1519-N6)-dimethyltransferase